MSLSLQHIKAIDVHAHPFTANEKPFTEIEFLENLSLSVLPNMFQEKETNKNLYPGMNMYMQITIQRLASYFSCEPTVEAVVKHRNDSAQDFQAYTKSLFSAVHLEGLLLDFGYSRQPVTKDEFDSITGVPSWEICRIEPLMDELKNKADSFDEFTEMYHAKLKQELKKAHVLGLKSIIAYRSGLEIKEMNQKEAAKQYEEFQKKKRAKVKTLRDYCLHIAMEECTKSNKVMHIHTGVGDGEVILSKASPGMLLDMLREEKYKDTKVHLVHGGYPWVEEAAFITSILPNVYMDISLQNPFIGHGMTRTISQVFEFAPFNKVMYGSDAFTVPEMNWLGVFLFKESFQEVLESWVEKDYMNEETAQEIGEMVLYRNFETVYQKSGTLP